MNPARHPSRGSVTLVALCLIAVLGIALGSYIAVCSRAMQLSNRSAQTGLSQQLAEMGLEEALRAFNSNNWADWTANGTTADWTLSGTTASGTITFPATKFGQGVTGTVKIRVDNYNANQLTSTWDSTGNTSYRINDLVGYGGMWYRCIKNHSSVQTPVIIGSGAPAYWAPTPMPWTWRSNATYAAKEVICYNGVWYRTTAAHTSPATWNVSNWTSIPAFVTSYDPYYHNANEIFYYPNTNSWYLWNSSSFGSYNPDYSTSAGLSWQYEASRVYYYNDLVCRYSSTTSSYLWYRFINATPTSGITPGTNSSYWEIPLTASWAWSSSYSYQINDVVYRSGSFYRCIVAHTNQGPPNATYWSTAPLRSNDWDSESQYSANNAVCYNGTWYRCITANNGSNPATSSNWSSTTNSPWSSTTAYTASSYVSYGGAWYRCILANTNKTPNNSTYWSALGVTVIYAEGRVALPDGTSTIKTQVRATIAPAPLFPNAAGASSTLTISGGGIVDSYDSTLGTYASQTPGYSAVLAATGTTNPAVTVTSTTVNGYVAAPGATAAPYAPLWNYGGSAVLRGNSTGTGIDLTRVSRSPSVPQADIHSAPSNTALPDPASVTWPSGGIRIGTPGATTPSVYYIANSLILNGSNEYLTINGPVILDIQGNLRTVNSYNKITISSTGSVEIHVSGRLRIESGSGGIDNQTLDPKKCVILSTSTSGLGQNYSASATDFYGVIYMPDTTSALTIDTGSKYIFGAVSAKDIAFTNSANIHYDTSLRYSTIPGVDQPYAIAEWRELTDSNERAVLP